MAVTGSRRDVLNFGYGTVAALGVSAVAGALGPVRAVAQGVPAGNASAEDLFYREDWFGEPWRKPEAAVLIHGNDELSVVWFRWVPRMGQEFRLIRPDLPGFGRSRIPAGFEWSLPSLATFVAHVLDKAGVELAHIIGAKTGGAIAMQFAADFPSCIRTLAIASGPASVIAMSSRSKASAARPIGFGGFERDGRILEQYVCDSAAGSCKGPQHGALEIRSGEGWCFAADYRTDVGDDRRPKRAAIRGKGPPVSNVDSQVEARGVAERCLSYRRRQRR